MDSVLFIPTTFCGAFLKIPAIKIFSELMASFKETQIVKIIAIKR
jgi:hypothetical protein